MSNKKLILGIAAGVAALAVVGIVLKRKGYLDGVIEKAEEFGGEIADKYSNIKDSARKKFDEVVQKGTEIADKYKSEGADAAKDAAKTAVNQATV
ncbi:hypothetical protein [Flavobacterium subsaxonicum]|uniref:YtxH domain-containing protein n=1 Tax=Flavobacterium subsaxonicum WB 4.1-42 = DSM 21790 TaxID=1121898 RepID=A0A0A2MI75_9FLAO|nr:hypothetical protein [Flavobacterium subsaxonicum]KGO92014.1 hypothetical protein Q766_15345 [Flavobacterium subsaxonicum WB 4.1-42 = DSM 21790]